MSRPLVTTAIRGNRFQFRALDLTGRVSAGYVDAESSDAAIEQLALRGLLAMDIAPVRPPSRSAAMSPADVALGLRMLSTLLESGLPVGRALKALRDIAPGKWTVLLPAMEASVREGRSLAAALAEVSHMPPVVVGIIHAGEGGSGLPASVLRAAALMENAAETRGALRAALAYPALLFVTGVATTALLVFVVLPRFAAILNELGQQLPGATRLVLAGAHALRELVLPMSVLALLIALMWRGWTGTEAGRRQWTSALLRLPVLGAIRLAMLSSRVSWSLAALLESGVPLSGALGHAAQAAGDETLSHRLAAARARVVEGQRLSAALQRERALTPTAIQLVRAGEESGRLAAMLSHAARLDGARASELTRGALRLIEPGIILAFGGLVAFVAAALLQAMYAIRPAS